MNVARLNFSHGTHADHAQRIAAIRAAAARNNQSVAILQDLQGPKIRTGALVNGQAVQLLPGATFTITTHPIIGDGNGVSNILCKSSEECSLCDCEHCDSMLLRQ